MAPFKQTESITRKLAMTLVLISIFFVIEFIGLFLSSQALLKGLSDLYQVNQAYSHLENGKSIVTSIEESLRQTQNPLTLQQTEPVFASANQKAHETLDAALALIHPGSTIELVQQARKSTDDLAVVLLQDPKTRENPTAQVFIALQYALEIKESLNKAQLELNSQSDQIFSDLYANRYRPLTVSLLLALVLLVLGLYLGRRISRHIDQSLANLRQATSAVATGDLEFRVPILAPDELGHLTYEFNHMTEKLNNSTVSRDYLINIVESMMDGVLVLDASGKIIRANKVMSVDFGYEMNELLGLSVQTLIPSLELSQNERLLREAQGVSKSGSRFPVSVSTSPLENHNATSGRLVCVIRDMTSQKKNEELLRKRNLDLDNANRELEAFSYSVSHDLRAPLRSVDGFSVALLEDFGESLSQEAKNYLARIRASVRKMAKLIEDLLNLSRITRANLHPAPVDLSRMARDILQDLKRDSPGRDVETVIEADVRTMADPDLMRVVLQNLLGNSWKYTSKHPHARIEFGHIEDQKTHRPIFYVRDDGAGFDMAYRNKLFGAFQRLHSNSEFPGTGVGLATAQRVIHRHGGRIWAESEVEKGTTFYFSL